MKLELSGNGFPCEVDADMENGNIEDEIAGSIAERSKQAKAVIKAEESSMPFKEGQDHYLISARSEVNPKPLHIYDIFIRCPT